MWTLTAVVVTSGGLLAAADPGGVLPEGTGAPVAVAFIGLLTVIVTAVLAPILTRRYTAPSPPPPEMTTAIGQLGAVGARLDAVDDSIADIRRRLGRIEDKL